MKLVILFTIMLMWLLIEIRDFVQNGGLGHALAFSLLRITLILIAIVIIMMFAIWANIIPLFLKRRRVNEKEKLDGFFTAELPDDKKGEFKKKDYFRKNSF